MVNKVTSIGGSDTSGGGGIEADIRTFQQCGLFGLSVIENIVTMTPQDWHVTRYAIENTIFKAQLDTLNGIALSGIKVGMIANQDNFWDLVNYLDQVQTKYILLDPVLMTKLAVSDHDNIALNTYREALLPKVQVITPNILEAALLTGMSSINTIAEMQVAAQKLFDQGPQYIIIKTGSRWQGDTAVDLLYDGHHFYIFEMKRIAGQANHGAGCTFSAAILAGLVSGKDIITAVADAKQLTHRAIYHAVKINQYVGHVWQGVSNEQSTNQENDDVITVNRL